MKNNKCFHNQMRQQVIKCIMQQMSVLLRIFGKTHFRKYGKNTMKYIRCCYIVIIKHFRLRPTIQLIHKKRFLTQ
jgi:hypothetical protein